MNFWFSFPSLGAHFVPFLSFCLLKFAKSFFVECWLLKRSPQHSKPRNEGQKRNGKWRRNWPEERAVVVQRHAFKALLFALALIQFYPIIEATKWCIHIHKHQQRFDYTRVVSAPCIHGKKGSAAGSCITRRANADAQRASSYLISE